VGKGGPFSSKAGIHRGPSIGAHDYQFCADGKDEVDIIRIANGKEEAQGLKLISNFGWKRFFLKKVSKVT